MIWKDESRDWWNRTQVERQDMNGCSIIIIKPKIRSKIRYKQTWQGILQILSWHLLLLLLLVLPRCPDMWTSVPAHIYPHLSKARLLLETNGVSTNNVYSGSRAYPGPRPRIVPLLGGRNLPQGDQEGLIECPYQDGTMKEGASTPLGRLEAHRSDRKF